MLTYTRSLIAGDNTEYGFIGKPFFGVCNSEPGVADKYATVDGFTRDCLVDGMRVFIKFDYKNTFSETGGSAFLNINGLGGNSQSHLYPIVYTYSGDSRLQPNAWGAGEIVEFLYINGKWIMPRPNTWYGTCNGNDPSAEIKTVNIAGFNPDTHMLPGTIIGIDFEYENTSATVQLKINGSTTKTYYVIGPAGIHTGLNCFMFFSSSNTPRWKHMERDISDNIYNSSVIAASIESVRLLYNALNTKYQKPSSGIPATDLAAGVIPTNVSSLTNDSGYLTLADLPIYNGTVV